MGALPKKAVQMKHALKSELWSESIGIGLSGVYTSQSETIVQTKNKAKHSNEAFRGFLASLGIKDHGIL